MKPHVVKVHQLWRDRDPRTRGRRLWVLWVTEDGSYAFCKNQGYLPMFGVATPPIKKPYVRIKCQRLIERFDFMGTVEIVPIDRAEENEVRP